MCGICGQVNFGDHAPVHRRDLERMTASIAHRGPDDEGYYLSGNVGLGFRRLSIIDLEGGHQPMSDQAKTVWTVFNGEIYNFPELREELEKYGHVFRTSSDTEVIVHGYKQWGDDVFSHLNGMFGIAIWDVCRKRLVLARDRYGIKLVYCKINHGRLIFGSEIRPIIAASDEVPGVDPVSLNLFLRYRYTPSPYTIYEGIRKLAPGSMLICEKGACSVKRWDQYKPSPFHPPRTVEQATEELLQLYRESISRHLLSDVPVGLLLSGGVDSALLLALMNENGEQWRTYTVGYGSSFSADELEDASKTASLLSSRHTSVELDRKTFEQELPRIVSHLEEPIASSSIVPMYFVCQRAREDVKVALMGQGPDELFGGYARHLGVRYGAAWAKLPGWLRNTVVSGFEALPYNKTLKRGGFGAETLKRGAFALGTPDRVRRYQNVLSLLPGDEIDGLFQDGILEEGAGDRILSCWQDLTPLMQEMDELGGFQFLELRSTLPDELLMYADKLSMAHGLEVRLPYLDRAIVEYVERLPANLKIRFGSRKWLHRQVSHRLLPASILERRKRSFAVNVVDGWFRNAMDGSLEETLLDGDSEIREYLRPSRIQAMLEDHRSGKRDYYKVLFSLVVFEQWLRVSRSVPAMAA